MKKHIALSLLIISPIFMHGMENNTWSLSSFSLRSYLPFSQALKEKQVANESKQIADLRISKNKFENQLQPDLFYWTKEGEKKFLPIKFSTGNIYDTPTHFLQFCFLQCSDKDENDDVFMNINQLDTSACLLKKCQDAQIDGYSALGATMIAQEISTEEKRNFIQELINRNFKLTPKDIGLAKLILYDGMGAHQETILYLLQVQSQAHWSALPHEIKKYIAQYMIQLFKNEFWLLPETS